jgi:hypothetical protein
MPFEPGWPQIILAERKKGDALPICTFAFVETANLKGVPLDAQGLARSPQGSVVLSSKFFCR